MPRNAKKEIDSAEVARMAAAGCSNVLIADALGCSEKLIRRRFDAIVKEAKARRKVELFELMWASAPKSPVLQIWMSKNMLGWSDRPDSTEAKPAPAAIRIVRPDYAKLGT